MSNYKLSEINPLLLADFYKVDHKSQYPLNTTTIYSNLTARQSRKDGIDSVVFFGLQYVLKKYLIEEFEKNFFAKKLEEIITEYKAFIQDTLCIKNFDISHIEALHKLGYLPLEIKAVDELMQVPIGVPMLTIKNTHKNFAWLVNGLETLISASIWLPITSATIAKQYRNIVEKYANNTLEENQKWFLDYQCHDFSMRGMSSIESAALSGAAHLQFFKGSDTMPAIFLLSEYYGTNIENGNVGTSVPATEHSVMCAGTQEKEFDTYKRLINEVYPNGIVSIVSDTWDFWNVIDNYLPRLKADILKRNGKVVIRPDSGDPYKIICGDVNASFETEKKGLIERLYEIFGGTVNEKGYKTLHQNIGAIYGDSITPELAEKILARLQEKGVASNNIVFGVGSYSYQYNTRDTFGFAIKATYCEVDGVATNIQKEPKTQSNTSKKSAKGLLYVNKDANGNIYFEQEVSDEKEKNGLLKTVFKNSQLVK
jgi:nicotinamide phosphoribosyltransferase